MELFIRILCYFAGVVSTMTALLVYAWYLGMQARIRAAEAAKLEMEEMVKQIEEQQKAATEMLQSSIAEIIKRRTQGQQSALPPVPTATDPSTTISVKERLKKAVELTTKQSTIDPKNGPESQMQYNELEMEKLAVLKSILTDGFDPPVTIRRDDGVKEMLLSTYVQSLSKGLA